MTAKQIRTVARDDGAVRNVLAGTGPLPASEPFLDRYIRGGLGVMQVQQFADVFDALADTPAEAADLKARSDLLSALTDRVKAWEMPRSAAARRLGIEPDRLDDLQRG